MDMSIRFIADESLIGKLRGQARKIESLPTAHEIYYLPSCYGNAANQIAFGVIRLRDVDGETIELSCNRRNYKHIGYEHEKYILFIGPKTKVAYLISALGLKEIGQIEQNAQFIRLNGIDENINFLQTTSTSGNKSLTTLKIEAQTEQGLLQGLQLIGLNPNLLEQIDPIASLLA